MENYQSLPDRPGSSNSYEKLKSLRLPPLKGLRVLDVGCNEGYFCHVAFLAGAAYVLGIDRNLEVVNSAKERFPDVNFVNCSWDEDISGTFDVILCLSAIHYADDQPLLIRRLVAQLSSDGILVLEQGIVSGDSFDYIAVRRVVDTRLFPTLNALDRILSEIGAYRLIGPSVSQSGDPVPRFVVHVRRKRPVILFFDTASNTGKSTAVRMLLEQSTDIQSVSIDLVFRDIHLCDQKIRVEHEDFILKLQGIIEFSNLANIIMDEIIKRDMILGFCSFLSSLITKRYGIIIIDGYIPADMAFSVRSFFDRNGYVVWNCQPFSSMDPGILKVDELFTITNETIDFIEKQINPAQAPSPEMPD